MLSEQDRPILLAQVANHIKVFTWSCLLVEPAKIINFVLSNIITYNMLMMEMILKGFKIDFAPWVKSIFTFSDKITCNESTKSQLHDKGMSPMHYNSNWQTTQS